MSEFRGAGRSEQPVPRERMLVYLSHIISALGAPLPERAAGPNGLSEYARRRGFSRHDARLLQDAGRLALRTAAHVAEQLALLLEDKKQTVWETSADGSRTLLEPPDGTAKRAINPYDGIAFQLLIAGVDGQQTIGTETGAERLMRIEAGRRRMAVKGRQIDHTILRFAIPPVSIPAGNTLYASSLSIEALTSTVGLIVKSTDREAVALGFALPSLPHQDEEPAACWGDVNQALILDTTKLEQFLTTNTVSFPNELTIGDPDRHTVYSPVTVLDGVATGLVWIHTQLQPRPRPEEGI